MEARDTFEKAREASSRIEELHRLIEEARPPSSGAGGPSGGFGDPTARLAAYALEAVPDMLRELEACEGCVGEALELIDGVRRAFETPWWRVLELYYIDGMAWQDVAETIGVNEKTCRRWRDSAFDWLDFVGEANARMGRGRAL